MPKLALLSVFRWGNTDIFSEYPVELRKAVKSTKLRDLGDGGVGVDQHRLHIADAGHLDVVCYRKTCDLFEFVGEVAGAEAVVRRQTFQRQHFGIVGVDIAGDGINALL